MITSTHNRHVSYCRSLRRSKTRREAEAFLVEGLRLAREALDRGGRPKLVLYDAQTLATSELGREVLARVEGLENSLVASHGVIEAAAETSSPAGLVMVLPQPEPFALDRLAPDFLLILDGISDGGNAGTILRTAAAAGLHHVVFTGHSVDPYLGKVVRAGMGAHFRIHILEAAWPELTPLLATFDQILGAEARGTSTIYDVDWSPRTAVIVGSEARGISPPGLQSLTGSVRVPMASNVESLNAAAVAAIILFHARHERRDMF